MSGTVCVLSAACIVVSVSLLVLVLIMSVDVVIVATCVSMLFVVVGEDVIEVRHGVYLVLGRLFLVGVCFSGTCYLVVCREFVLLA